MTSTGSLLTILESEKDKGVCSALCIIFCACRVGVAKKIKVMNSLSNRRLGTQGLQKFGQISLGVYMEDSSNSDVIGFIGGISSFVFSHSIRKLS